ncbi:MAG: hypothetical protein ACI892_001444 [Marinobacter maritimus]|jgi:hypothetical protein
MIPYGLSIRMTFKALYSQMDHKYNIQFFIQKGATLVRALSK